MKTAIVWAAAAVTAASVGAGVDLPLKEVVLFTSGVGYFERSAEIEGKAEAELSFKTEQINDLIKSMVLLDEGGGKVSSIGYESRDPVERTLKSFSVDLTSKPDLAQLLDQLRGVTVRVKTAAEEWNGPVIGVEKHVEVVDKVQTEKYVLNLLIDGIIRSTPFELVKEIEVKDAAIQKDLVAALKVLAGSHDQSKKSVKIAFTGDKKRTVRVGYMLECPVWRTSYRLVLADDKPLLQGWAHIENMTDDDWQGVSLSLVSGQPVSFIQNLYDPVFAKRPEVKTELYAAVAPQEFDGAMPAAAEPVMLAMDAAPMAAVPPSAPMAARRMLRQAGGMEKSRGAFAGGMGGGAGAVEAGLQDTIQTAAGRTAGELFEYPIAEPVSLPRRQSAMIPIVNSAIKLEKLSVIAATLQDGKPMNGVEIENTSGLFLMQGPATVYEAGIYAGDARLTDTQKGEKKLLTYAVDLAGDVKVERKSEPEQIVTLKIVHGALSLQQKFVDVATYRIGNKRDQPRRFLVEYPQRQDWTLVDPPKDLEKTRDLYRFRVEVPAAKTGEFVVREQRTGREMVALSNLGGPQIEMYISMKAVTPAVKEALKKLAGLQTALNDIRMKRSNLDRRLQGIVQEQARIRDNMKTVDRNQTSFAMWEKKLVAQEKDLETITTSIEELRGQETAKQGEINAFLANLNVE